VESIPSIGVADQFDVKEVVKNSKRELF
jgi:hypothetical protein